MGESADRNGQPVGEIRARGYALGDGNPHWRHLVVLTAKLSFGFDRCGRWSSTRRPRQAAAARARACALEINKKPFSVRNRVICRNVIAPITMLRLQDFGFTIGTAILLRTIYVLGDLICRQYPQWEDAKKRRIFVVRIVSFTHAFVTGAGSLLA